MQRLLKNFISVGLQIYKRPLTSFSPTCVRVPDVTSKFLIPSFNQIRTFKDKDVLTKRCKDCYFRRINNRWFVFCTTHPRHKQRQRVDEKSKWIITHKTHGVKKF